MGTWGKITASLSIDVLSRYEASETCKSLITEDELPSQSIDKLASEGSPFDAVQFICHGLGARDSIFFGVKSLELRNDAWSSLEKLALAASQEWVFEPDEVSRIRAHKLSSRLGLRSGPSWLAEAVFWSGSGSISGVDEEPLLPPEYLYARAVCAAIATSAVLPPWPSDVPGSARFYEQVLTIGRGIVNGSAA
ncbi:MAG TPA: hypothetical protein DHW07_03140 [Gammaproteobacteria bacterium]|nr:hypothetical protein [Gammaproteobacteria bacterium]